MTKKKLAVNPLPRGPPPKKKLMIGQSTQTLRLMSSLRNSISSIGLIDCSMANDNRGKLGNGEHLSLETYKYESNIYDLTIMQHKEEV